MGIFRVAFGLEEACRQDQATMAIVRLNMSRAEPDTRMWHGYLS